MNQLPVIFKCSHHRKGNTDHAADLFLEGIRESGGDAEIVLLGAMDFIPCSGCLKCRTNENHRCIFAEKDDAQNLFDKLLTAPFTFFAAPVYFYHLPSRLKTFIDRGQWGFEAEINSSPIITSLSQRPAYTCLAAGRPKGEKLFEGSLLTLKFFFKFFKIELQPPITYKGIDLPDDLRNDTDKCSEIFEAGKQAWERSRDDS